MEMEMVEKLEQVVRIYENFSENVGVRSAFNALRTGTAAPENLRDTDNAAKSANLWIGGNSYTIDRNARRAVRAALVLHDAVIAEIGVFGDGKRNSGYEKIARENMENLLREVA